MIKQYLDYKRKKVDDILASPLIDDTDKQKVIDEYNLFVSSAFSDKYPGKIILSKKIVNEVMQLAMSGEIPLLMDMYDTFLVFGPDMPNSNNDIHPFKEISDLVAVHKSVIPPISDTILTKENNGYCGEIVFVDPATKKNHKVLYPSGSDTIHFTLNCVVENHQVGNDWDSYKYAVMIGLDKLDKIKILDVKSEDTYIDGNAELGNDYFLFCPLGEKAEMKKANPKATVIEYEGIHLNHAILSMIAYSGRKIEPYGTYGWDRQTDYLPPSVDNEQLDELLEENNYPNLSGEYGALLHSESKYMARRMWKREYEAIISLIEYNRENEINMSEDTLMFLISVCGAYATPGLLTVSVSEYKEYVLPILKKHGYFVGDELFEGIAPESNGSKYISHFSDPNLNGLSMPSVQCPEWENTLRHRVIEGVMGNKKVSTDGEFPKSSGMR